MLKPLIPDSHNASESLTPVPMSNLEQVETEATGNRVTFDVFSIIDPETLRTGVLKTLSDEKASYANKLDFCFDAYVIDQATLAIWRNVRTNVRSYVKDWSFVNLTESTDRFTSYALSYAHYVPEQYATIGEQKTTARSMIRWSILPQLDEEISSSTVVTLSEYCNLFNMVMLFPEEFKNITRSEDARIAFLSRLGEISDAQGLGVRLRCLKCYRALFPDDYNPELVTKDDIDYFNSDSFKQLYKSRPNFAASMLADFMICTAESINYSVPNGFTLTFRDCDYSGKYSVLVHKNPKTQDKPESIPSIVGFTK